ncbi:MAG TPA: cytochrome c family protein [Caulobacteraceae bacterium]|jgi:cytochrome c|nr:cytochrome c family protein [Caulobacteraceae bacterium]
MRVSMSMLAVMAAAGLLAGCGRSQTASTAGSGEAAPAAPAPEPTPEQAKALIAALPAPYNAADLDNGKHKFAQCRACHTTAQGGPNMTGPNLWGVFGRKAGGLDGFSYSDGMKAAGWTWDAARIDKWITDPRATIPGTKMTFFGIRDPKDRVDVVAYLKSETTAPK